MMAKAYTAVFTVLLACIALVALPQSASAAGPITIQGQVVNGSTMGEAPANVEITLHVFDSQGGLQTRTAVAGPDGGFSFEGVETDESQTYLVSTIYKGVTYSQQLEPSLEAPLVLEVFEGTHDLGALNVDSHVWLIREIDESRREVTALEIVLVTNGQDATFQPTLDQPGSMNFLRFSLPPQASALEVQSDLQGGDVISVGTGFGMTAPVLPGSHQIVFTYRFPYVGDRVGLSRSFLQGADTFRVLLPQGLGEAQGPRLTEVEDPAVIGDASYRVWEARSLEPGAVLFTELRGLPQPSLWQRTRDGFSDGQYLQVGIPSLLGLGLVALLVYALMLQRRTPVPALTSGPSHGTPREDVDALLEEVAHLDNLFEEQRVPGPEYRRRRAGLKLRIVEGFMAGEGDPHGEVD